VRIVVTLRSPDNAVTASPATFGR